MKAYITYFKLKFICGLQYRQAAWAGIATQFFFGIVYVMVYLAFYESGSDNFPMKISALVSYLWLNQAFFALINQFYKDSELFDLIKNGNISYELLRPKNLFFMWYFKILGQRLANVMMRFFPLILIVLFLPKPYNLSLPLSITHFILFIFSLGIGALLVCAMSVLYPIITLVTLNEKGVVNILIVIADILSGVVVPIPFFPKWLKFISKYLPFQYISDLPFRIYVGDISLKASCFGIAFQFIWFLIIILFGLFLMTKNIKRIEVQGG